MRHLANLIRQWLSVPTKVEADNLYRQLESVLGIYNLLNHDFSLGPLRSWAISPDALQIILVDIAIRRPSRVVEFGSGQSTVAIAKLLATLGGSLTSVEHDSTYYLNVHKLLTLFAIQDKVHSIIRPLLPLSPGETTYDLKDLPVTSPEVVLIDGPPGGQKNRLAPLRWAYRNISEGGVIYLDDYCREYEKTCVRLLQQEFPDLILSSRQTEKSLAIIEKPAR
jgi:predicted O-methyltransferase YrrM